ARVPCSRTAMTSSTSEQGTPVKKSKRWRVRSAARSCPVITRSGHHHAVATHHPQELTEGRKPHERILSFLLPDGRRCSAVIVAGKEQCLVGQRAEALGQRVVHLARIAAGQIRAAARVD